MFTVDLCSKPERREPADPATADEMFRLAMDLARVKPELAVRIPVGPERKDRAVLDGALLAEEGTEVF